jgi:hypothetical protein
MPAQKHTHFANRYKPHLGKPKFAKRVCFFPAQEEFSFFFSHPSVFLIFCPRTGATQDKHLTGLCITKQDTTLDTDDRTPSANIGFAKAGVQCFG